MIRHFRAWATGSLRRKLILLLLAVIIPALIAYVAFSEWTRAQTIEEAQLGKAKAMALSGAEAVSYALETALKANQLTRDQIFDTNYQPIPGTNPQKYQTAYDSFTDANLLRINDKYLDDGDVLYAVAADINGYVPTHNTIYAQPLTGDYETDLTGNRTKRIFSDTVGLAAAQNTAPYLRQLYYRDNGQIAWDVAAPVRVAGQHWGAYRIGISLDRLNQARLTMVLTDLAGAVLIIVILAVALYFIVRQNTRPLNQLSAAAAKVSAGDLNQTVAVTSHDEIGTLAVAFNSMTAQIKDMVKTLEERVQARTGQLRASAEVSRAVTSILDPEQLLAQVAGLITDRFGFYYTGVFVLNEADQQAVLRAATGEAGQVLLARGHYLPVDEKSMVGTAIITGRPRIALDVGQGAVRFVNPLLPNTRSEIALPLRVGNRSLGALDVQSEQAGAFDESNTEVLQAMADQIAVALLNAQTFQRSEQQTHTMALLNELSRQLSTATSLEDVAAMTQPTVSRLLGAARITIAQTTANPQLLSLREFTANPQQPIGASTSLSVRESLISECIAHSQTTYLDDLSTAADRFHDIASFHQQGMQSGVILPLRVGERVVGALTVGADRVRAYSAEQIDQLEQITAQVAITIENLNLAEQTQQTLAELNAANRQLVGQAWEQYTHTTSLQAAEWRNGDWLVLDPRATARVTGQALVPAALPLTLPIKVRGATIGEFHITAAEPKPTWDEEDAAFAQSLVDQVGQVLETARLLDETERTAQREKAVANAADKIHRATNVENVLQSAVTELQRITGRHGISVQLGFGHTTPPDRRAPQGDTGGDR